MRTDEGRRADHVDGVDRDRTRHDRLRISVLHRQSEKRHLGPPMARPRTATWACAERRTAVAHLATRLTARECPSKRALEFTRRLRDGRQPRYRGRLRVRTRGP